MTVVEMKRASLLKDDRGATMVEFAFVAPAFLLMLMAGLDLGYQQYLRAVVAGTVESVAREASVGSGMNSTQIDNAIRTSVMNVVPSQGGGPSPVTITKKSYYNFSRVGKPEKITSDTVPLGVYNATDCYEDANGNNNYDASAGSTGVGGADDIVFYQVDVAFPRIFPMAGLFGWNVNQTATVKTVIRNQPFDAQTQPREICP